MIELFFLHIPKTAGQSFTEILRGIYGADKLFHYPQKVFRKQPYLILEQIIPDGTIVLHGHYMFSTISDLLKKNDAPVVTWLRDPVERVISNYYFYLKRIRDGKVPHEQCRDQETVIEYARRRSIRNRISSSLDGTLLKDIFLSA